MIRPILQAIEADADLFGPFEQVVRDVSRLYNQYAGMEPGPGPTNVSATENEATVELELPGIDPSSLDIEVQDRVLSIEAKRGTGELGNDARYIRRERPHGSFHRTLRLPFDIEADAVKASYLDGILKLELPRAEASKPRKIAVNN